MNFFSRFRKKFNDGGPVVAQQFISVPVATLWRDVATFIGKLETEESADWCKCLWRIHPDDVGIKPGHCRICNTKRDSDKHYRIAEDDIPGMHNFRGIRKTKVDQHPTCTVHTKEGLIIGFIEWVGKNGD